MRGSAWLDAQLVVGLVLAACAAACGASLPPSIGSSDEPGAARSSAPASPSAVGRGGPPVSTGAKVGAGASPALASPVVMKAPAPTALAAELQALGLDVKDLPPIEKVDPRALRGVMKLMAKSLGIKCGDCHLEGDFSAPTRRKKIAAKMWDEFVDKLTTSDGSPLFCDSCHAGRVVLLDRTNKKALSKWMGASFVDGLARKDGQSQECESCHVDWDMTFLSKWGR